VNTYKYSRRFVINPSHSPLSARNCSLSPNNATNCASKSTTLCYRGSLLRCACPRSTFRVARLEPNPHATLTLILPAMYLRSGGLIASPLLIRTNPSTLRHALSRAITLIHSLFLAIPVGDCPLLPTTFSSDSTSPAYANGLSAYRPLSRATPFTSPVSIPPLSSLSDLQSLACYLSALMDVAGCVTLRCNSCNMYYPKP